MSKHNITISRIVLLKVYKTFLQKPNKTFVRSEFVGYYRKDGSYLHDFVERYLNTLIKLGLIERVNAIYKTKLRTIIVRSTNGYRLVKGVKLQ